MPIFADAIGITWIIISPGAQVDFDSPRSSSLGWTLKIRSETCKTTSDTSHDDICLTYEELFALLYDAETILNSWPFLPILNDVSDLRTLTLTMMVTGKEMQFLAIPVPPFTTSTLQPFETHSAKRWAHMHKFINIFCMWGKPFPFTMATSSGYGRIS